METQRSAKAIPNLTEISEPHRVPNMAKAAALMVLIWAVVLWLVAGTESVEWWAFLAATIVPPLLILGVALTHPEGST
jgi:cytochrome bd-type quinol oxidase subunit 2